MKERPIIFSGAMVKAILAGAKTQTRRLVKVRASYGGDGSPLTGYEHGRVTSMRYEYDGPEVFGAYFVSDKGGDLLVPFPYGVPGDRLWVRETWQAVRHLQNKSNIIEPREGCAIEYAATCENWPPTWRPSIFMPRWASRITLEIVDVRVQRLQEISESDARAEGVERKGDHWTNYCGDWRGEIVDAADAVTSFRSLWDSINAARAPWSSNPWVWALTFRRVAP